MWKLDENRRQTQEKNSNEQRAVDSADRKELKTNDKTLCMGNKNKAL